MKKALLAALTFIVVGFLLVNSTFALPNLETVFATVAALLEDAFPEPGGETINVALVSDNTPQQLYPGGSASRTSCVENQGTGNVYFRLVYAVQHNPDSGDKLTISFDAEGYVQSSWQDITIGTTPYKMMVFTYPRELPASQTSPPVTLSIAMDSSMTSAELDNYRSDFIQTQVLAIDPTPFTEKDCTTAQAALDVALPLKTLNPF